LGNISTNDLIEILTKNRETLLTQMEKERCFIEINKEYIKVFDGIESQS